MSSLASTYASANDRTRYCKEALSADWKSLVNHDHTKSGCETKEAVADKMRKVLHRAICLGHISPNAELVIGNRSATTFRYQTGNANSYDLASLTKPIATASSIMKLVEAGKLKLTDQLSEVLSRYGVNAFKGRNITIADLLSHRSGLDHAAAKDIPPSSTWGGREHAGNALIKNLEKRLNSSKKHLYVDSNYLILGELVRLISGEPLDEFAQNHVFKPAGMSSSRFATSDTVADGLAKKLQGVAGHAGMRSNGDDLATFARVLLNSGKGANGAPVLSPASVEAMTRLPHADQAKVINAHRSGEPVDAHALGFDGNPASFRGDGFSLDTYGHTGSTGTSLIVDPRRGLYVVLLATKNESHSKDNIRELRKAMSDLALRYSDLQDGVAASSCQMIAQQQRKKKSFWDRFGFFSQSDSDASSNSSGGRSGGRAQ